MAYFKSFLYLIVSGGVSYTLLCVASVKEEDFVKNLPEIQKYPKADRKKQEQLLKILQTAARVPDPMSQQVQGDASYTNSKLKSNISGAEK